MRTIDVPDGSFFGRDNLPYGVFSTTGSAPQVGVRLGNTVVNLAELLRDPVFDAAALNGFLAQGPAEWSRVRERIRAALDGPVPSSAQHAVNDIRMHLPFEVADYVDFYASEHHAANLGRLFRPDAEPLLPNWKHLPVGYHGRAGTVVVSGTPVVRPCGQRKASGDCGPTYGPSGKLDVEAELGFVLGVGSPLGGRIGVDEFAEHVFGAVLVNDWSARDLQAWEYVPLGPHLGKSFATSISPWVVPMAALQSARVPLPRQAPSPLPYLRGDADWGLDVELSVSWNGQEVSRPRYRDMYWSPAQMLAHLTVNGASTRTGDLFASGTISGPERDQRGAFIELTWGGRDPLLVRGEERVFLLDGDQVTISATAPGPNSTRIGFGEVTGVVLPAVAS